jgi:hypothetical protein
MDRDIGERDVGAAAVGIGIDDDTADTHPAKRMQDANGNLAAICDQDGVQAGHAKTLSSNMAKPHDVAETQCPRGELE